MDKKEVARCFIIILLAFHDIRLSFINYVTKTLKMKSKQYNYCIEGVSDINLRTMVVQISFVGIVFKFYEFVCLNSIDRELLLSGKRYLELSSCRDSNSESA